MRITFNLQGAPPADNGGTATIFNSANTLARMGHKVVVVSEKKNEFTWFPLKGPEYIQTQGFAPEYPGAKVLIATGAHTVQHVLNAPASKGAKFWWVRAHESWSTPEQVLLGHYQNSYLCPLVNSICLQRYIQEKVNRTVPIVRPGMSLDKFYPVGERKWTGKDRWILGTLFSRKSRKRFQWAREIYAGCRSRKLPVELWMYGTEDAPKNIKHDRYLKAPSVDGLRLLYGEIDIWLAPTKSEGLHMPPQEAMLCECLVIGADDPLSGMRDYLSHGKTGYVMSYWSDAVDFIEQAMSDPSRLSEITKAGRERIIEMGDRDLNMINMVQHLERGEEPTALRRKILSMRGRGR